MWAAAESLAFMVLCCGTLEIHLSTVSSDTKGTATMSGTAFTSGQLAELQTSITVSAATALKKVTRDLGDPKQVLKALKDKNKLLSDRMEGMLVDLIRGMMPFIHAGRHSIRLSSDHNPQSYWGRKDVYVYQDFLDDVVEGAEPTKSGVVLKFDIFTLGQDGGESAFNAELGSRGYEFDRSTVCAIIAELIGGAEAHLRPLVTDETKKNLFFLHNCLVEVAQENGKWAILTWQRADIADVEWISGSRLFVPVT